MYMKQCYFCNHRHQVDYKEVESLKQYLDDHGRISKSKYSGLCAKDQRKVAQAIKRARFMALLPFIVS